MVAILYMTMAMDAPYHAVTAGAMSITPSSHRNLLLAPFSTHRTTVASKTDGDEYGDDSRDGLIQAHINIQTSLVDDAEPGVRSLYPTRSSHSTTRGFINTSTRTQRTIVTYS